MNKLIEYDLAAYNFYAGLKINSLPINSWDSYAPVFSKICENRNDIYKLKCLAEVNAWDSTSNLEEALFVDNQVIVVTDPELTIVHVTQNIFEMNGYKPNEILGKKPKMFQGVDTDEKTVNKIRLAVKNKTPFQETVLNYRKNGTPYYCWIKGEPIFNSAGEVVNFIAYEKEVA